MWKSLNSATFAFVLLAAASLTLPDAACAQGAQHNETDLDFAKRMTARLERVEKQTEKLLELATRKNDYSTERATSSSARTTQDEFGLTGSQDRMTHATGGNDYQRVKLKLRSLQRKAGKEREKLATVQGSKSRSEELDREAIEKDVARMESDVVDLDRQIRTGRY